MRVFTALNYTDLFPRSDALEFIPFQSQIGEWWCVSKSFARWAKELKANEGSMHNTYYPGPFDTEDTAKAWLVFNILATPQTP